MFGADLWVEDNFLQCTVRLETGPFLVIWFLQNLIWGGGLLYRLDSLLIINLHLGGWRVL